MTQSKAQNQSEVVAMPLPHGAAPQSVAPGTKPDIEWPNTPDPPVNSLPPPALSPAGPGQPVSNPASLRGPTVGVARNPLTNPAIATGRQGPLQAQTVQAQSATPPKPPPPVPPPLPPQPPQSTGHPHTPAGQSALGQSALGQSALGTSPNGTDNRATARSATRSARPAAGLAAPERGIGAKHGATPTAKSRGASRGCR